MTINKYLLYFIVLFTVFALFLGKRIFHAITYKHSKGVVIGFDYSEGRKYTKKYPIIEFEAEKYVIEFTAPSYMAESVYVDKIVDVIYDPKDPGNAYVNNFYGLWGNAFIFLLPFFLIWTIIIIGKDFVPKRVRLFSSSRRFFV